MDNKILRRVITICLLFTGLLFAVEPDNSSVNVFSQMDASLEDIKNKNKDINVEEYDLFIRAMADVKVAEGLFNIDPKWARKDIVVKRCSVLIKAAIIQIEYEKEKRRIESLQKKRDKIIAELETIQKEMNVIERSYGTKLKTDLAIERRKAKDLREQMQNKFKKLEGKLIQVRKDARGTIISMSDILFDVGKADVTSKLRTNLAKISGILSVYKDTKVIVEGHTDNIGGDEYNKKLSVKRAKNVVIFLVEQGISSNRLKYRGFGKTKPIADNSTKDGRQKNRRVDLVVLDSRISKTK